MTSRQVQWRRFTFFDKDTIAEDIAMDLGAEVSTMHTAGGRLYLGDESGIVTISDGNLNGKIQRQAYSGPVRALVLAPEGTPPVAGASRTYPLPSNATFTSATAGAGTSTFRSGNSKKAIGVVVTLGDDSVNPSAASYGNPIAASAGTGTGAATALTSGSGNASTVGVGAVGNGRSPCVLKFWAGTDMAVCIRAVDVALQFGDGQDSKLATTAGRAGGGSARAGRLPRLTAFAVTPDATQVACGFSDGTALLFRGDVALGPSQPPRAPLLIQPGEDYSSAVTALHFSKKQDSGPGGSSIPKVKLLVGYDLDERETGGRGGFPHPGASGLLSYDTRTDAESLVLDELGCKEGCSAFGQSTQEVVVGRNDGVYFFSSEDRGGAAGFEGSKQHVGCLWNYILVVSKDGRSGRHTINVYDMRNKLVAFHVLLPQGQAVKRIACQGERYDPNAAAESGIGLGTSASAGGGLAFVLTDRNALLRLRERDTPSKLELLFRKNLYPMAISLAYASDHDVSEILGIYRMYGDHLYKKGDFEGAMQQYQNTIGHLDPSYVIRRFLDAQRIGLLTSYLEGLHEAGQASSDHTTLLLNCHTKLKDVEKLDRFIHPGDATRSTAMTAAGQGQRERTTSYTAVTGPRGSGAGEGLDAGLDAGAANFDVVTAIRVLKSAGHADHAAELARRHGEHDWFLRIQLERSQPDFPGALAYIASLPFSEAAEQLRRRGKPLVTALPEDTTGVLMALCTGRYSRKAEALSSSGGAGDKSTKASSSKRSSVGTPTISAPIVTTLMAPAEDFVHLYVDEPRWLRIFLMYVLREGGKAGPTVADTLLELLLREWAREPPESDAGVKPRSRGDGVAREQAAKKQREAEVMSLLDSPRAGYDADHALVLVQMLNFKPGQLYLYEKLYMTDLVLEHYVDTGDTRNMMRVCRKEGTNNPDLWVQVLSHLVENASSGNRGASRESSSAPADGVIDLSSEDEEEDRGEGGEGKWDDVRELLALIERDQVLPPLKVLSILAENPSLPLWVTRDFLPRYLAGAASSTSSDEAASAELRESTGKMRAEIQGLRATMQSSSSGAGSRVAMELPTFWASSEQGKGPSKPSSPIGMPQEGRGAASSPGLLGLGGEQAKIQDIKAAQARSALDHEQFFKGLEEASDGFGQVASYFGKGVMS